MRRLLPTSALHGRNHETSSPGRDSELSNLRRAIRDPSVRNRNIDGEWWIPRSAVESLITHSKVSQVLDAIKLKKMTSDSGHDEIMKSSLPSDIDTVLFNKLIFIMLLDLSLESWIMVFVNKDARLPLSRTFLTQEAFRALSDPEIDAILEHQHHFIERDVAFGSLIPREYDGSVILPFRAIAGESTRPASGSFGIVQRFEYRRPSGKQGTVYVRKQFEPCRDTSRDYMIELRNLTVLSTAKHPNILRPVAAYAQRRGNQQSHNLIFPFAVGGSLDHVLSGLTQWDLVDKAGQLNDVSHFPRMVTDAEFVSALAGLASAIATMHTLQTDAVEMIGCHRDLKPSNILVDGHRLILADFGLSRMKKSDSTSESNQPEVMPNYYAPECYSLSQLDPGKARRSSDIWSLGCILLKLLVCREYGQERLKRFEDDVARDYVGAAEIKFGCFFEEREGEKILNSDVGNMINQIRTSKNTAVYAPRIADLVASMLSIQKDSRPSAGRIASQLQRFALFLGSKSLLQELKSFYQSRSSPSVYWEALRLRGWKQAMCAAYTTRPWPDLQHPQQLPVADFECLLDQLRSLQDLVTTKNALSSKRTKLQPLRLRVDQLMMGLAPHQAESAKLYAERKILSTDLGEDLEEIRNYLDSAKKEHASWNLEAIRSDKTERMLELKQQMLQWPLHRLPDGSDSCIDYGSIDLTEHHVDNLCEVKFCPPGSCEVEIGLAEVTTLYGKHHQHIAKIQARSRLAELQGIADDLNVAASVGAMQVLRCHGPTSSMSAPKGGATGLVYQIPHNTHSRQWTNLRTILTGDTRFRLALEHKFEVAHKLATTVYHLHTLGWVHRRLSALNVVLFYDQADPQVRSSNFYVVGFAQSRAETETHMSDGASMDSDTQYFHPDYGTRSQDFASKFDRYALGVLLLEIGCSRLRPQICEKLGLLVDSSQIAPAALDELEHCVGSRYRAVTEACLGTTGSDPAMMASPHKQPSELQEFKTRIVDPLQALCGILTNH